jgi:hypothetical protein
MYPMRRLNPHSTFAVFGGYRMFTPIFGGYIIRYHGTYQQSWGEKKGINQIEVIKCKYDWYYVLTY